MAIINTSGLLTTATGSTNTQTALSGQGQYLYLSVQAKTFGFFSQTTGSTGTGENLGLNFASGENYVFQFQPGEAKYWYHVSSATGAYGIMEVC